MSEAAGPAQERVFLVVIDDTPEMRVALRYAANRARHVGGRVVLLHVYEPPDRQHWMALESLMREERMAEAELLTQRLAAETAALTGTLPAVHLREGATRDELLKLIDEDPSISVLILAAASGDAGPGPLVSAMSSKYVGRLRIPVTLVPGGLTEAEIDALS
ncbi:MAG TPA: universal stress protein [Stellaceae bacterium]|nr:universal stress protein [Stellaceae bacterium]